MVVLMMTPYVHAVLLFEGEWILILKVKPLKDF